MFVQIIIALMALSLLVFALPARMRWIFTLIIIGAGAVLATAEATAEATAVLAGASTVMDRLSALFVIVASLSAVAVVVYAKGYVDRYRKTKPELQITLHYCALAVVFFSILLVLVFRDGFGFLFAWELMTISSFFLVMFYGENHQVRRAAVNYLILMHIGFVFLLAGFVALYKAGLPVSFDSLPQYFSENKAMPVFLLFLVGFGMKAGLFPLHVWLPEADPAAPSHVAAFMSGVMTKMGVYGVLRVVSAIGEGLYDAGMVLFVVGCVTGLWGVILAVMQGDMRRTLAYSTIENIGVIFIGIGIGLMAKASGNSTMALLAMGGALLHVVSHCFMKHLLFMGTGNVFAATGITRIDSLGGLGRRMPVTAIVFLIACLAISAAPALGGFASEFMIYLGMFDGLGEKDSMSIVSLFGILFMALIGGLVLMTFVRIYGVAFLGSAKSREAGEAKEVSGIMLGAMAIPLAGVIVMGLAPFVFARMAFSLAGDVLGLPGAQGLYGFMSEGFVKMTYAVLFLVGLSIVLWIVRSVSVGRRGAAVSPTWMGGFTAPTSRMQYTGESFSDGLGRLSGRFIKHTGGDDHIDETEIFPDSHKFQVGHKDKLVEYVSVWWVSLLRLINARFSHIRSGKVNHYVLYALLFMVLIFILSFLNII